MTPLDEWFESEILAHEKVLTRYLKRVWPRLADIPDLRQEVYVRVYESAARKLPDSPRAFLLATARNLVLDRIRRERIVSVDFRQDFSAPNVLVDRITPEREVNARQELRHLCEAIDRLPANCRAVVWLRRVDGYSQREVAERLGMQEGTVASHLARGLKALTKVILGHDIESVAEDTTTKGGDSDFEQG